MSKKEKKKSKRQLEKEYVPLKGLMGNATDYHVYSMRFGDRLTGFLIGFGIAFAIMFIFFRSMIFCIPVSLIVGFCSVRPYKHYKEKKRKEKLLLQFKDMLEGLVTSYSAGSNTLNAFVDCEEDLKNIYGEESDIVQELRIIINGLSNGLIIEDLLNDFAARSDLEDVQSFADVFAIANRQGGNVKQIVSDTRTVINDKIEMEMEISSLLNGGKNEINILIVMPVLVVLVLGGDGDMSIVTNTMTNVVVKFVCLAIYAGAYMLGRKIMNIKV